MTQNFFPLFAGLLLGLILIGIGAIFLLLHQVVKQQGRLLLRVDAVEEKLRNVAAARKPAPPAGLPVGETFPSFKLSDLDGNELALEKFSGRKILVVNWSPTCGFCVRIAPELARLKQTFPAHQVELLLASFGDADANRKLAREHGLESSVVLRQGAPPIQPLENFGTPSAYLLDEQGKVAKPIAVGSDQVPLLARYAIGEATEAELDAAASANRGTCGQNGKPAPAALETGTAAGPGTELKKMLAKIGIGVTADCPCSERAAAMDRNGWEWCDQNIETIVGWLREESARREMIFVEFAARFLIRRAIAKARRRSDTSGNAAANRIPDSGTTRTA